MKTLKERYETARKKYKMNDENQNILRAYQNYKSSWENMKQRLYSRAYEIVMNEGYFVTLTYKDPPNEQKVIHHMKTWSKKTCELFISNIDYGDDNGRIHIHSLCLPKEKLHGSWNKGIINFRKVKKSKRDARNTALYVTKLVNHSIKDSASYIYRSKKIKKGEKQ